MAAATKTTDDTAGEEAPEVGGGKVTDIMESPRMVGGREEDQGGEGGTKGEEVRGAEMAEQRGVEEEEVVVEEQERRPLREVRFAEETRNVGGETSRSRRRAREKRARAKEPRRRGRRWWKVSKMIVPFRLQLRRLSTARYW